MQLGWKAMRLRHLEGILDRAARMTALEMHVVGVGNGGDQQDSKM